MSDEPNDIEATGSCCCNGCVGEGMCDLADDEERAAAWEWTDSVEGEVVDPGMVYVCETGNAETTRAQMDRRGQYGGQIRESDVCPKGLIFAIDQDGLDTARKEAIAAMRPVLADPTPSPHVWLTTYRWTAPLSIPPRLITFTGI